MIEAYAKFDVDTEVLKKQNNSDNLYNSLNNEMNWVNESGIYLKNIKIGYPLKLAVGYCENEHIPIENITDEMFYGNYEMSMRIICDICRVNDFKGIENFKALVDSYKRVSERNVDLIFVFDSNTNDIDIWVKGKKGYEDKFEYRKLYGYEHINTHTLCKINDCNLYKVQKIALSSFDYKETFPDYSSIVDIICTYYEKLNDIRTTI